MFFIHTTNTQYYTNILKSHWTGIKVSSIFDSSFQWLIMFRCKSLQAVHTLWKRCYLHLHIFFQSFH